MTKSNNGRVFALIAAIIYLLLVTYDIGYFLIYLITDAGIALSSIDAMDIIYWFILAGLGVTLFTKNKIAVICAAGAALLLYTINLLSWISIMNVCDFLAFAALIVLLILALLRKRVVAYLWFLPGAIMLTGALVNWIGYDYFSYLSLAWRSIAFSLLEIAALVFAGLWLKGDVTPAKAAPAIPYAQYDPNAYAPQTPYAPQQAPYAPQQAPYAQQQAPYAPRQNPYAPQDPNAQG